MQQPGQHCHSCQGTAAATAVSPPQVNRMELPVIASVLGDRDIAIKRGVTIDGKRYEVAGAALGSPPCGLAQQSTWPCSKLRGAWMHPALGLVGQLVRRAEPVGNWWW